MLHLVLHNAKSTFKTGEGKSEWVRFRHEQRSAQVYERVRWNFNILDCIKSFSCLHQHANIVNQFCDGFVELFLCQPKKTHSRIISVQHIHSNYNALSSAIFFCSTLSALLPLLEFCRPKPLASTALAGGSYWSMVSPDRMDKRINSKST